MNSLNVPTSRGPFFYDDEAPPPLCDEVRAMEAMGEAIDALPYTEPVLVTEDNSQTMPDHEAFYVLKRISAVQAELADIDANAKTMKAQAVADIRDFLGSFDRLQRLSLWRAINAGKARKTVTTLAGSIGERTLPAKCRVSDEGLALPWLKVNAPAAVKERILAAKLPAPVETVGEHGEAVWQSPCAGLDVVPERNELTVNGRMVSALLKGAGEESEE